MITNNRQKPPVRIFHASLKKLSNESPFKVYCPACKDGIMLVRRQSGLLSNVDHCIACGQVFIYLDDSIGGEKLIDSPRKRPYAQEMPKVGDYIEGPGVPGVPTDVLPARKVES